MDNRRTLNKIEFYITNVCNLTCEDCNRFNNFKFSGWQRWQDYAEIYAQWAKKITFNKITILGGEPLLNPTICDWILGINNTWDKPVQILSNGTRLNHVDGLYNAIANRRNWIGVSLHNVNEFDGFEKEVYKFLKGSIKKKVDENFTDNKKFSSFSYTYTDNNGAMVSVYCQDSFINTPLIQTAPDQFKLYNNDPVKSHSVCGFAIHKNYHFIKGKFYKCGPSALLPEFDQQFNIDLSDEDRQLLHAYQPLSVDQYDEKGTEFFDKLDQPIPQCKFCPHEISAKKIFPISKEFSL
jgi:organic radical activating enzyme